MPRGTAAPSYPYARDGRQPVDEAYTQKMKEYTTAGADITDVRVTFTTGRTARPRFAVQSGSHASGCTRRRTCAAGSFVCSRSWLFS